MITRLLCTEDGLTPRYIVTATQPRVATLSKLTGTSYAVIMIDLDIPTNTSQTNTLLHWMQTGLTPAGTTTMLNSTSGMMQVFMLQNTTKTAALAPYIGPGPPARLPLSHRYTQILVDISDISTDATGTLQSAAKTRTGFDAMTVLTAAGLEDKVVAGNFFNVTNPGPIRGTMDGGTFANGTTSSSPDAAGTGSTAGPTTVPAFNSSGRDVGSSVNVLSALLGIGVVFVVL